MRYLWYLLSKTPAIIDVTTPVRITLAPSIDISTCWNPTPPKSYDILVPNAIKLPCSIANTTISFTYDGSFRAYLTLVQNDTTWAFSSATIDGGSVGLSLSKIK
jgi:hypothetical protein